MTISGGLAGAGHAPKLTATREVYNSGAIAVVGGRFVHMTLAIIFGTRPEAIKTGPVVAELRQLGVEIDPICTNQHTTLLSGTPADTDLADARSLELPSTGEVWSWVETATDRLTEQLWNASAVLVQGDTMTALAGARAAKRLGLPLHHVEAGLRSHDLHAPWPEELIRVEISQTATWHYAPTQTSRANLVVEGVPDDHILVTGNSGVSAIARYGPNPPKENRDEGQILVTMHRRESRDSLQGCVDAVTAWAVKHPDCAVWWPLHPNARPVGGIPRGCRVTFIHPIGYWGMQCMLPYQTGIATDSGGLQEEAATLGVPCAVLRTVTDRPESIEAGVAKLFEPTPEGITQALDCLWTRQLPRAVSKCFGTETAAASIAAGVAFRLMAKRAIPPFARTA